MFCRFCGKEIENDSHYCRYCGKDVLIKKETIEKKVEKVKVQPQTEKEEKKAKPSKKYLWLLLLIPIVAFILISAFSCGPSEGYPRGFVSVVEKLV